MMLSAICLACSCLRFWLFIDLLADWPLCSFSMLFWDLHWLCIWLRFSWMLPMFTSYSYLWVNFCLGTNALLLDRLRVRDEFLPLLADVTDLEPPKPCVDDLLFLWTEAKKSFSRWLPLLFNFCLLDENIDLFPLRRSGVEMPLFKESSPVIECIFSRDCCLSLRILRTSWSFSC